MDTIQVKLTNQIVTATIIKKNHKTLWVQLPDGNIIKRHKKKHVVKS